MAQIISFPNISFYLAHQAGLTGMGKSFYVARFDDTIAECLRKSNEPPELLFLDSTWLNQTTYILGGDEFPYLTKVPVIYFVRPDEVLPDIGLNIVHAPDMSSPEYPERISNFVRVFTQIKKNLGANEMTRAVFQEALRNMFPNALDMRTVVGLRRQECVKTHGLEYN